jgi:hypothetical protein
MRVPFAIGRMTPKTTEIVLVDRQRPTTLPGPWEVCALVRIGRLVRPVRA